MNVKTGFYCPVLHTHYLLFEAQWRGALSVLSRCIYAFEYFWIAVVLYVGDVCLCHCVGQLGLRTLQDLAPEMRLAMVCDTEEEEGDEIFDSGPGTSATTTPATTPLPPIDTLVEQTAVIIEPEPRKVRGGVITEQVTGLHEHLRPGSELAGLGVVTEQPVMSLPRCFSNYIVLEFVHWFMP